MNDKEKLVYRLQNYIRLTAYFSGQPE